MKYNIGDWVTLEGCGDKIKYRIVSVITDICIGGQQTSYLCRCFLKDYIGDWYPANRKELPSTFGLDKLNEIELIPYVEIKKEAL